ncbi:acyltransferase [Micromonospora peucetia]|uniref:Acyltransferase n=1 Tax=Micromonospora peucetia TaxID=47871 RepID=A0A1C6VSR3_9ACTN|nr:acyltransferase [Micromonospora peucetia]MCX4388273.1 acyltransferase [Micromonospora peucetia]WSA31051.1 acyltransferase [Micromonospora peucetia]SCL69371.1 Acyltransferase family protein [Micromonospora peucetia]
MRRLRQLAARTPAGRQRYVDLLRALAIGMVVLGHWAVAAIGEDATGRPTGRSALPDLPWAYPLTWLAQVMPVFFLVGGYANAASLTARRAAGVDATAWLLDRGARLLRPTTALLLVIAGGAALGSLAGVEATLVRTVAWFATIPLWFLAAYLIVVPLTPVMYALHRRFGLLVPLALAALVVAGDVGRALGPAELALPNYVFGWLAVHQLGIAWRDADAGRHDAHPGPPAAPAPRPAATRGGPPARRLPQSRRAGAVALLGGLAATVLLTTVGPYPVAMLNVPGERLDNAAPPSLALLTLTTAQFGLILLLRGPAECWLRRPRPWQAVIAVNMVVLTVFLWHLTAAILLVGALDAAGKLPTPPVGSAAWLAWRVPWVLMLTVVLAALVAVFGPVEARTARTGSAGSTRRTAGAPTGAAASGRAPAGPGWRATVRTALTAAGFAAVVYALVVNAETPKSAPEPLGIPASALVAYLAGAGTLRLLRSGWGSRG